MQLKRLENSMLACHAHRAKTATPAAMTRPPTLAAMLEAPPVEASMPSVLPLLWATGLPDGAMVAMVELPLREEGTVMEPVGCTTELLPAAPDEAAAVTAGTTAAAEVALVVFMEEADFMGAAEEEAELAGAEEAAAA